MCVITAFALVFTLASCGGNKSCEHTYSTEYSSDANGHWYVATCGCAGEVSNYGVHADTNNDGACDKCKYTLCAHTYSEEWSSNESKHWNASTCDCTATKANEADHIDDNKDGVCDVCTYVVCAHTYGEWQSDETNHWKEPTCDCEIENANVGAHADENLDGLCDACAYVMCAHTYADTYSSDSVYHWYELTCGCTGAAPEKVAHADGEDEDKLCDACGTIVCDHTYADTLSYDDEYHWYASTCGCDIVKDKTAHTYEDWATTEISHEATCACGNKAGGKHVDENEDDACDTCGFVSEMKAVIENIDNEASLNTNSSVVDNNGKEAYAKYYDNYTVIADAYGNIRYYSYYGANGENMFVMLIEAGAAPVRDYYAEEPTELYAYNLVYYNVQASNHEDAVKGLYDLGLNGAYDWEGNKVGNSYGLVADYNEETGVYSFSYLYIEETNVYKVMVEFTLDAEYNGISTAKFTINQYSSSNVEVNDTTYTYTIKEGASYSSSAVYTITQTFGDPMDSTDAPNPYPAENYVFSGEFSVVMKDADGNVTATFNDGDTVELEVNQNVKFYFDDATTAKLPYLNKEVISNVTGAEAYMYFSTYNQAFPTTYIPKTGGNFTLTFTVEGVSLVLNVKVNYIKPTTIGAAYNDPDGVKVVGDKAQMYLGDTLTILSNVATGNDPAFTAAVTTGADAAMLTAGDGFYTFKAVATGTYVVTITSAVSEGVTATLTIEVVDAPNVADVLTGKHTASYNDVYQNETGTITVVFTPKEEGATEGTLTLNIKGTRKTGSYYNQTTTQIDLTATYNYAYNTDTKQLVVTYVSGDSITASVIITNYIVAVEYGYAGAVKLAQTVETPDAGDKEPTSNPFKVTVTDTYTYDTDTFEFVADEAGKYVFTVPAGLGVAVGEDYYVDYYANTNGDTFSLTLAAKEVVIFRLASLTKGDYYMSYTVEASEGGEDDDEPTVQPGLAGTYQASGNTGSFTVTVTDTTITFQPPRSQQIVWCYTYVDGALTLTQENGNPVVVMPGMQGMTIENGIFTKLEYNGYAFDLVKEASKEEPKQSYAGEYIGVDGRGNEINVTITEDAITWVNNRGTQITLTYTVDNGVVTVYLNGNVFDTSMMDATVDTVNCVFTKLVYNGTTYTMTKVTADGGDNEEGGEDDGEGEVTGDAKDANGLGGTYTFTFVVDFTITIKPSANGATSGTIDFVDSYNSQNTGTYAYTIVDGAYVIEGGKLTISQGPDGAWYAQTPEIVRPQMFAEATTVGGGEEEGGDDEVDTVTELVVGDNNVSVTGDDMNMTVVTFTATEAGTINIIVGENGVVVYDYQATLELRVLTIEVTAGQVITLEVNNMYGNAGVVVITVETIAPKVEDPQAELKELLAGDYVIGDYTVGLNKNYDTDAYYITVMNDDMTVFLAFTYTVVDNGNGTFSLTNLAAYDSGYSAGAEQLDAVKATIEAGTISANLTNNAAFGYYSLNGYELSLRRDSETGAYVAEISGDDWTTDLYFTYVATANEDGSYTIALTYTPVEWESGADKVDSLLAMTWVVTPEAE